MQFGQLQKVTSGVFAPKGPESSAQGFNPGNRPRAMRPEGGQIKGTNNLEVESNGSRFSIKHSILYNNRYEIHLPALSPLQGEPFIFMVPRVETR
jgi:hypothetical protein